MWTAPPSHSWKGWSHEEEDKAELFYNVTVFSQEVHLRLHRNTRLIAPTATIEWEESGNLRSEQITDVGCFYTGMASNMEDTSVAISNCDGLVGVT